jgi:hypothetical protein
LQRATTVTQTIYEMKESCLVDGGPVGSVAIGDLAALHQ